MERQYGAYNYYIYLVILNSAYRATQLSTQGRGTVGRAGRSPYP